MILPMGSLLGRPLLRLLKWSERYTKTDMVYLAGNGGWLALGQVAVGLIALASSVAFAHFVPKDVYGNYRFLLSVFWILTAFSLTGIPIVLARAVARGEVGAYPRAVRLSLLWSIPIALAGLGMAGYYLLNGNTVLGWGCIIIALIGPFMQSAYLYGSFLEGKQAFRENAIAGVLLNLIPALALLGAMLFFKDAVLFLGIYLGTSVLTGFYISYLTYRRFRPAEGKDAAGFTSLSGHFSAMYLLLTISQQVDRILVFHYLGAVELAVYTFATAMPDQIKTVFNNVATLALPKFVRRPLEEVRKNLGYRLAGLTALAILVAGAYALAAPFVFHLLFPTYGESVFYSVLYALSLIPIGTAIPLALLEAHAAKRELYIYNVAGPLFQIVILFFLVTTYGLLGAIIARIAGRVFYFALGSTLVGIYARRMRAGATPA